MWKELLVELFEDDIELHSPAAVADIRAVELKIAATFPPDLKALLLETDGFETRIRGLCLFGVRQNQRENFLTVHHELFNSKEYRELYQSFSGLLFFASDGMGGYFAFDLRGPEVIVWWDHEEDTRRECGTDLADFLARYDRDQVYE